MIPRSAGRQTDGFDVVIIGSGPAGVAVAERLYAVDSTVSIAVLERGPLLLRHHFYDSGGSIDARNRFFARHRENQWEGDLFPGGGLLPCLGGRGIVGGSQLHRFYEADFHLWPDGIWGIGAAELIPYFAEAEVRLLRGTRAVGGSQDLARTRLAAFNAQHPPADAAVGRVGDLNGGFPHRSSAERLLSLLSADRTTSSPRLAVLTGVNVVELVTDAPDSDTVSHVRCVLTTNPREPSFSVRGSLFVLAASPVESARLVLTSDLPTIRKNSSMVGCYLAEHTYFRGYVDISENRFLRNGPINLFIPPLGDNLIDRFQIELRSIAMNHRVGGMLRLTGSAAMDPNPNNRVTIRRTCVDKYGQPRARTVLHESAADRRRLLEMIRLMDRIVARLGGKWSSPPAVLPRGASYHEAGTLRSSARNEDSAADLDGRLHGTTNVFVGDGAVFACVGVANPILTLTALGYRLGDKLAARTARRSADWAKG